MLSCKDSLGKRMAGKEGLNLEDNILSDHTSAIAVKEREVCLSLWSFDV